MPQQFQRRKSERQVITGLVLAVVLLALANLGVIRALSAVGGYLNAESLWAKGRSAATLHMLRYAMTGDAAELPAFEDAVAVPLHFRAARLALEQPQPDRAAARSHLLAAGSHADEVGPMVELFASFRTVEPMATAVAVWRDADAGIQELLRIAGALPAATTAEQRAPLLAALQANNRQLQQLEARFAQLLGQALRRTKGLLSALTLTLAALLAGAGIWIARRAFKRVSVVERELRETNQRWALAAQGADVEMFEWDIASDRLVWHRDSGTETTTLAEHLAALPAADGQRLQADLQRARDTGTPYSSERTAGLAADGSPRWVSVSGRFLHDDEGRPVRLLGMRADITERKRAQAALAASELRFRTLLDTATDAVVVFDESHRIEYANAAVQRVFGWDPAALVGQDLNVLQPPALRAGHRAGIARYLRTGEKRLDWRATETLGLHRSGQEFAVEVAFSHMHIEGRHRFAGFLRDIGERKAAEAARNELQAQLRQAQKMESLGQLAGGVAHDFNNIVGAILGNVVLARDDLPPGHPALASVEQISRAALRARELVGQILAFSRRQPVQLAVQPLQPIVQGILHMLRSTLPAAVELRTELDPAAVHARVDRSQIEQVLMNLCTNAWHAASGDAPQIVVGVRQVTGRPESGGAAAADVPAGDWACLWVADNGVGMDEATRERIFEPFFTTKPVGHGTGLGLALVQGIVAAHQGLISVQSTPGAGSRFSVYLPLAAPGDASAQGAPAGAEPAASGPQTAAATATPERPAGQVHRILYVDDDELMRLMMQRLLEREGYAVTAVDAAAAALQLLDSGAEVDLLLTDFNMPGTTGLQLARSALQAHPGLPVVLVSGDISEHLSQEAASLGLAALVRKEQCFDMLPGVLAQVLAQRGAGTPAGDAALPPTIVVDESRRLAALRGLQVLDSEAEPLFDAIVQLAADLCEAPMALLSLVDEDRQWFKAGVGLQGLSGTPREIALCAHTIVGNEVMVVPDARCDERFTDNPLVTGPPHIRLYAGAPLVLPGGERVGTLSVLDRRPREIGPAQLRQLQALAGIATAALLLRRDLRRQASPVVALMGQAV